MISLLLENLMGDFLWSKEIKIPGTEYFEKDNIVNIVFENNKIIIKYMVPIFKDRKIHPFGSGK
ncbi:MAG: hypothetical protein R2883_06460 [Caldisericia bacterium]